MKRKQMTAWILALILMFTCLQPTSIYAARASADDSSETARHYEQSLENYTDFLASAYGEDYLLSKQNFTYELYRDQMDDMDWVTKFGKNICDFSMGTNTSVQKCMEYLSTLMQMMSTGTAEGLASQSKYKVEKEFGDRAVDAVKTAVSGLCETEFREDVKWIQATLGVSNDLLSWDLNTIENVEAFYTLAGHYANQKTFLTAVRDHAETKNLRKAADALLEMLQCQLAYRLQQLKTDVSLLASIIKDTETLPVFTEKMITWLKGLPVSGSLGSAVGGFSQFLGMASSCVSYCSKVLGGLSLAKDIGGFFGDLAVGDVYRYLNEAELMSDVSRALMEALEENDPNSSAGLEQQYAVLTRTVPLLSGLCAARARGEYCLYSMLMNEEVPLIKPEYTSQELEGFYHSSIGMLQKTYELVGGILVTSDFSVTVSCHPERKNITNSSGVTVCETRFAFPEVDYPGKADAVRAVNDALSSYAEEVLQEFSDLMDPNQVFDSAYQLGSNGCSYYYLPGDRLDETVLSIRTMTSYYYNGSAHPLSGWTCLNFDTRSGEMLTLSDIIASNDAYQQLASLASRYIQSDDPSAEEAYMGDNITRTLLDYPPSGSDPWKDWFFTAKGLCFSFDPYVVASYARGYVVCEIPYAELSGLVKDKYLSPTPRKEAGEILATTDPSELSPAKLVVSAEGPGDGSGTLSIYALGNNVYDVTVFTTSGSSNAEYIYKDLPIVSVSLLTEGSHIDITCGPSDTIPNLYVTWRDANGYDRACAYGWTVDGEPIERSQP